LEVIAAATTTAENARAARANKKLIPRHARKSGNEKSGYDERKRRRRRHNYMYRRITVYTVRHVYKTVLRMAVAAVMYSL
jgi:hypothetical protein